MQHQQESRMLGVVHGIVHGCFLIDWPSCSEDQDSVVDFCNHTMDLRGDRMRLWLSFLPGRSSNTQANISDSADAEGDIDDNDVLTEDQIASLGVASRQCHPRMGRSVGPWNHSSVQGVLHTT